MLSQTGEYALRALVHLARKGDGSGTLIQAEETAEALGVPRSYLSKILHTLGRAGLLESSRGPGGGFRLAVPEDEVPLARIVDIFDPHILAENRRCLMGRDLCSDADACPAHARWKEVSSRVRTFFRETTLADLARGDGDHPPGLA